VRTDGMGDSLRLLALYVEDADPGFLWSGGRTLGADESETRQRVYQLLVRTVLAASVDRRTRHGRLVWTRRVLVVETPLLGSREVDGPLLLLTLVAAVQDRETAQWDEGAFDLAVKILGNRGYAFDSDRLSRVLGDASRYRPSWMVTVLASVSEVFRKVIGLFWSADSAAHVGSHSPKMESVPSEEISRGPS
jgi:hypothetical protein